MISETDYRVACLVRTKEEETFVAMSSDVLYLAGRAQAFYELPETLRWLGRPEARQRVERLHREL